LLERAASNVAVMDTVQSYFRYVVETRCGIPFITLKGSVEDWTAVAAKVRRLKEYGDLGWWLDEVTPIVDQFVAAAGGNVDLDFWGRLYKSQEGSGSMEITGWLLKLLPLVRDDKEKLQRNPLLGKPTCEPLDMDCARYGQANVDYDACIDSSVLPSSLSTVPFIWEYLGEKFDYQFVAGIVGFTQNESDGALCPQMGWAVRPAPGK